MVATASEGGQSPPARVVWIEILFAPYGVRRLGSPPARVVWIEIPRQCSLSRTSARRHPRGWCGLKYFVFSCLRPKLSCRHPRGWCGLKYFWRLFPRRKNRRHPRGWCGLKSAKLGLSYRILWSPPARVVWIEIRNFLGVSIYDVSPPARVVWIEIFCVDTLSCNP